jgi:hypothetical protein
MKKIAPFLILLLIMSCKSSVKTESTSKTISISSNEVKEIVTYLASDELQGRNTGSVGIEKSAVFIESQLQSFGVKPYFETYRDNFKAKEKEAFNVVGFIEGTDAKLKKEIVIIGAHYDHIGFRAKKVDNDSIANGANDNAAGTSAVLSMAKYFAAKKNNKRSIMIVLFSAEEMGLLGSKHLAGKLKDQNIDLYTMVNFEMIGVPFKDRDYVAFVTGYGLSNIATKMNEYAGRNLIGFSEVAKKYNLFKQSDNYAFYNEFKLPSHTVSSCDLSNYDQYHKVGDEARLMDYEHMASLINSTIPTIEQMCNTPTKEIRMYED